jgi:nitrogen-specific signal transduction histidine kinase
MKNEFTQNAQPGSHEGNSTNGEEKEDAFQEAAIQLLSCLFEHATESVLVLNTRATILYINPSCASMLKSGEQPLTGIPFESLLYEGQLLTWHDILAQALRQKDYPIATSFTLTIRAREGAFQQTYLSCSARLVYREFPMLH